jgi:hypothetical protein
MSYVPRSTTDEPHAGLQRRQPCLECKKATLIPILAQHGARCVACFEEYCRKPPAHSQANATGRRST